ncbi:MAG: ParA family protein [Spirochaetia bacterium]|nr:ParA family protein [Spirochaetia bacterium]
MGKIITVANHKGGVGKTTTVFTLGLFLSKKYKVLLVDLDPTASLTTQLEFENSTDTEGVSEFIKNKENANLDQYIVSTKYENIDILKADEHLYMVESKLSASNKIKGCILKTKFSLIKDKYDFIIIDTSPAFGALLVNALISSNLVVIPVQNEFSVFHGLNLFLSTIEKAESLLEKDFDYKLLLTMYEKSIDENEEQRKIIQSSFSDLIFKTLIDYDPLIKKAGNHGESILGLTDKSKAAKQYEQLSLEIEKHKKKEYLTIN